MPTPDPNNVLFKIAHPDLYERNPFNVLNLPVDATAKDIRRRKEDIEAAFDAGTEAAEFKNVLPGDEARKTPTRAEVDELFATLEDPEKRIAYALFWFWPEDMNDIERETIRKRNRNPNGPFGHRETVSVWDKDARMPDDATTTVWISRHNLAVFSHMMGLAYELELKAIPQASASTPDYVNDYWRSSISWWNAIVGEPEFWRYAVDLVNSLADPRVDHRFVRSLRDQFAFAFDQVNVELAIDFAKTGREADAKRQVEYMKISQPDSDDVEGTFDDAFAGLLRQTETIVKTAVLEAKTAPKDGIRLANGILRQTEEPLQVSRIVFEKGAPVRNAIVASIFRGVHNCLVAFGNEVKDWRECLKLTETLASIAETPEQKRTVETDLGMLKALADNQSKREHCWCCGAKMDESKGDGYKSFHLWGKMRLGNKLGAVRYQTLQIEVPVCKKCNNGRLFTIGKRFHTVDSFPELVNAKNNGFELGNGPSQDQIRTFLGF